MKNRSEVIVVGAGPAGIVAAVAARQRGLDVTVLDSRTPPINKACGEGILPQGVAALRGLGISLPQGSTLPFRGIRFVSGEHSVRAEFDGASGYSIRRTKLHEFLVNRAAETGVEFRWGEHVMNVDEEAVTTMREKYRYRWLIGADGQNSQVRRWAGLSPLNLGTKRYGFCSHLRIKPWSDVTEVYWAHGCQIFVTLMAGEEVCVAVISRRSGMRLDVALPLFPLLADRLRGAAATTRESGETTSLRILPAVACGRIALIGDASGTVDALTGYGLSLSFQQAVPLAEAMILGDLGYYQRVHQRISSVPVLMTRLMLLMAGSDWIRHRMVRLLEKSPTLFSRMLEIHTEAAPLSSVGVAELASFGWNFLTI